MLVIRPARIAVLSALLSLIAIVTWATPSQAATTTVAIQADTFSPRTLTVPPGTTVQWRNDDGERHRIRSTGDTEFDSGNLDPGETFSFTFPSSGSFSYTDARNSDVPGFQGVITVQAGAKAPSGSGAATSGGSTAGGSASTSSGGSTSVSILDKSFSPSSLTVQVGDTVTWTNTAGRDHNVTFQSGPSSSTLGGGGTFQRTFDTAGTFNYLCTLHSGMTGSITVGGGSASGTTAKTSPTTAPKTSGGTASAPASGDVTAEIVDFSFAPATIRVEPGTTVVWTNNGESQHTVTSKAFDSGWLATGDTYRHTFDSAGTFSYLCALHPQMTGEVVVGAGGPASSSGTTSGAKGSGGTASGGSTASSASSSASSAPAGSATTASNGTRSVAADIVDFSYQPTTLKLGAGDTVTWTNRGQAPHTVTGSGFDSGMLSSGDTFRRTFADEGTFSYKCTFHPDMVGKIVVGPAGTGTTPARTGASSSTGGSASSVGSTGGSTSTGTTSGSSGVLSASRSSGPASVDIADMAFSPASVTITPGETVTWTNADEAPHTVTADGFDSGIMKTGDTFSRTFDEEGTFTYRCMVHPAMTAEVVVSAAAGQIEGADAPEVAGAADGSDQVEGSDASGTTDSSSLLEAEEAAAPTGRAPWALVWVLLAAAVLMLVGGLRWGARRTRRELLAREAGAALEQEAADEEGELLGAGRS